LKKRFVIAVDSSTKDQNVAFREHLKARTPGLWWHWLSNLWLIVDTDGKYTASELVDVVQEFYPATNTLVIELPANGDTWSGFGPNVEGKNMFGWLEKKWQS
jgi:hypothetical protein